MTPKKTITVLRLVPGVLLLAALLWTAIPVQRASADPGDLYVDGATGADSGTCPLDSPCLTVAYALSQAASGDTLHIAAGTYTPVSLTISRDLTFVGAGMNATVLDGGASGPVFAISSSYTVTITDLTIRNGLNTGPGGGIQDYASSNMLTLARVKVSGNTAAGGGGIFSSGPLTITDSVISNNTASGGHSGGGIFLNAEQVDVSLTDVTISGNTAEGYSGGLHDQNDNSASGATTLTNVTISGNTANQDGAMTITNKTAITIVNSTIAGNHYAPGGGTGGVTIYGPSASASWKNTILAGNDGSNCYFSSDSHWYTLGNNLESGTDCGFTGSGDLQSTDPLLEPLADHGGPGESMALPTGSPAIDAGTDSGCPATDQRGVARSDGTCDIGAVEYSPVTVSGNAQQDGTTLAYTDGSARTATTSGGGDYTFTVPWGWSGMVTPLLAGYAFAPASLPFSMLIGDRAGQDFSAYALPVDFEKTGPANGATAQPPDPALSWTPSTGAASYEYCVHADAAGCVSPAAWTSAGTDASVGLSGLTPGATYYWQVRAVNGPAITPADGDIWWSFSVVQPGPFNKSAPAGGPVKVASNPTLSWTDSTDAASYAYCIRAASAGCVSPASWISTGTHTSVGLSGLTPGATYYWQVRAVNGTISTQADSGTWWSFTVKLPLPGAFKKSAPANGATKLANNPTLTWTDSSNVTSYQFCYGLTTTCSNWTSTGTARSKTLTGLTPGKKYYWQVRAYNATGYTYADGSANALRYFTVSPLPGSFGKSTPANGALDQVTNPYLSWTASSGASSYEVCYNTSATCSSWSSVGTARSKALSGLVSGKKYYWQVRAHNGSGYTYANAGSWRSFTVSTLNVSMPATPVKLIFVHHSTGENWLADGNGNLGRTLMNNNYFVSDTNYGWGPDYGDGSDGSTIGDHTDIPDWLDWFASSYTPTYMTALFTEYGQHASYSRLGTDPGGENRIIMFKSCFPNSALDGNPTDPPSASGWLTVGHAKYVYNTILLNYFKNHPEKLFIIITAPPLMSSHTTAHQAANARAFNNWLVDSWLPSNNYTLDNVAVFDFYDVLTSNGGNANTYDLNAAGGHHHRYSSSAHTIQHLASGGSNYSAYPTGDDHPSAAGGRKASAEFVQLLNIFYHRWQASLP